jgi:putative membrane protein insertion efficiency factor
MELKPEMLLRLARKGAILALSVPIQAYRYVLSPMLPPSCRFAPSCSAYALEALATHGPLKGAWLAIRRVSRCHPITFLGGSSGFDPVPPGSRQEQS